MFVREEPAVNDVLSVASSLAVLLAVVLTDVIAAAPPPAAVSPTEPSLAAHCPARIDSRVAASTPRLLVFGEVHGTQQAPAFIYQLACDHVLRAPTQPLLIGLELGHDQHSALQALLRHPDDDCAIRQLLAQPDWSRAAQDGRTSLAQLELIRGIGRLRQQGAKIDVLAFDVSETVSARTRSEHMANRIDAALRAMPESRMFVLTGNSHAGRSASAGENKRWMVEFLALPWHSYNFVSPRMNAWSCNGPLPSNCHGDSRATYKSQYDYPPTRALSEARPADHHYDAEINLGPTTASAPAIRLLRK